MTDNTNGNEAGSTINREIEFRAFDELPVEVRRVLCDAPINLGSHSARRLLQRYDANETATTIREFIVDVMTGGDHPESTRVNWTWRTVTVRFFGKAYKLEGSDGNEHPQRNVKKAAAYVAKRWREGTTRVTQIRKEP